MSETHHDHDDDMDEPAIYGLMAEFETADGLIHATREAARAG